MKEELVEPSDLHLQQFKNVLYKLGSLKEDSWEAFSKKLCYKKVQKSKFLISLDEIENNIYFILKGAVRVFVPYENKELSTNFRFENQFTSSVTSFLQRSPSQYYIKTLIESELLYINHADLNYLYKTFLDINVLGRHVMEQLLIDKRQRELDFLTLSAEERYHKLLTENPEYVLQIPLKHIASFLGIAAESLSRIRARK